MTAKSLTTQTIERAIHLIRGQRVLLDVDLARLYGVKTGALNRAVKRNLDRFPDDFMFQLTPGEDADLKSQSGTSSGHGGRRRSHPHAFTEHGVAMLASVLSSPRAIEVNIEIVRVFVRLRHILAANADLAHKLDGLEAKLIKQEGRHEAHDEHFRMVFEAIRRLMQQDDDENPPGKIGFEVSRHR